MLHSGAERNGFSRFAGSQARFLYGRGVLTKHSDRFDRVVAELGSDTTSTAS